MCIAVWIESDAVSKFTSLRMYSEILSLSNVNVVESARSRNLEQATFTVI